MRRCRSKAHPLGLLIKRRLSGRSGALATGRSRARKGRCGFFRLGREPSLQEAKRRVWIVGIRKRSRSLRLIAVADERVEVDDLILVERAVQKNWLAAVQLVCLLQGQYLGQLVQGAEASREDNQRAPGARTTACA